MRITLWGFLNYDPTIFDDITLPEGLDKDYCVDEILRRSGDLFPYHQQPIWLKRNITNWFARNYSQLERMINALLADYDPIENYDRKEEFTSTPGVTRTATHSGTDTDTHSGTDTDTHSGTDKRTIESKPGSTSTTTNEVSAFDSSGYSAHDRSTVVGSGKDESEDNFIHGEQIKTDHGLVIKTNHGLIIKNEVEGVDSTYMHAHGNIGTTTNATMVSEELELRRFDIYADIARRFEKEFLIQVY